RISTDGTVKDLERAPVLTFSSVIDAAGGGCLIATDGAPMNGHIAGDNLNAATELAMAEVVADRAIPKVQLPAIVKNSTATVMTVIAHDGAFDQCQRSPIIKEAAPGIVPGVALTAASLTVSDGHSGERQGCPWSHLKDAEVAGTTNTCWQV